MNKKILIFLPIGIILIIAIIILILYFTTDIFKSNEELFWKYFAQNEDLSNIYINDKSISQTELKQNNSYITEGNISVLIEQGQDSSKQLNLVTTSRHDLNTQRTYADATLKNGELDLFKVSYINSSDIYGIKCDEVLPNYIGIQNSGLSELASSYQLQNAQNIPDSIDFNQYTNFLDITDAQKTHIAEVYVPIIMNSIAKDQYINSEEQINVNNASYDVNVYSVEITGEELKEIIINCLNTLKSDTETLILISNKLSVLGAGTDYTDTANLSSKIEELIIEIEGQTIENSLSVSVYEQDGNLIRTSVIMDNVFNITYDKESNFYNLIIDFKNRNVGSGTETDDGIIDLTQVNTNDYITTRIEFNKQVEANQTVNSIKINPDINNAEEYISFTYNLSSIQNNIANNSYELVLSSIDNNMIHRTSISYTNNLTRMDQVDEIEELNSSNTAIANNYGAEEFKTFFNTWTELLANKFSEKLVVLGFENTDIAYFQNLN